MFINKQRKKGIVLQKRKKDEKMLTCLQDCVGENMYIHLANFCANLEKVTFWVCENDPPIGRVWPTWF